ncbi:MAG: hypothetical protein AAGI38_22445 [Bacteroidota bacterium]
MQETARSFPTKSGYFHIYSDRIELEANGVADRITRFLHGMGITRMWGINLMWLSALVLAILVSLVIDNYLLVAFFGAISLWQVWNMWRTRDISSSYSIQRDRVDRITYHPAVKGSSRAFFTIHFFTKKGRSLRRTVSLPGSNQEGGAIAQSAQVMLREEGLLATE